MQYGVLQLILFDLKSLEQNGVYLEKLGVSVKGALLLLTVLVLTLLRDFCQQILLVLFGQ